MAKIGRKRADNLTTRVRHFERLLSEFRGTKWANGITKPGSNKK